LIDHKLRLFLYFLVATSSLLSCKATQSGEGAESSLKDVIVSEKHELRCSADWICSDSELYRGLVKAVVKYGADALNACKNDLKNQLNKLSVCKVPTLLEDSFKSEDVIRESLWVTCSSDLGEKFCKYMDQAMAAMRPCDTRELCGRRWYKDLETMRLFRSRWQRLNIDYPAMAAPEVGEKAGRLADILCQKRFTEYDRALLNEMIMTVNETLNILEFVQVSAKIDKPISCKFEIN
jgi:hypothetical protein